MMFGAISGSAIAASTSIGGVMVPMSAREGYDRGFAAAVNIASAPTGMLIPPTTAFILYALASGEHRLPLCSPAVWSRECCGALAVCWSRWWSLSVEIIGFSSPSKRHGAKVAVEAIPSLLLIVIIVGGIVQGFSPPLKPPRLPWCIRYC